VAQCSSAGNRERYGRILTKGRLDPIPQSQAQWNTVVAHARDKFVEFSLPKHGA